MEKPRKVILKERVRVLNELINKVAESPNPHENDFVYATLYYLRKEIKEELLQTQLEEVENIKKDNH